MSNLGNAAIAVAVISTVENITSANSRISEVENTTKMSRRAKARAIRIEAANFHFNRTPENLVHPTNGDESLYPNKIANFSKGLPHQMNGEVIPTAYKMMMAAIDSGEPDKFEEIPLGGKRRLINPQAGYSFGLECGDSQCYVIKTSPAFASREQAAEIAENYWMAVLRDVNFLDYEESAIARDAAADLNRFGDDYKGAKDENGLVTTKSLFRGTIPGTEIGPYLSQFWYLPTRLGANWINTRIRTVFSPNDGGLDYLTDFDSWLANQNGGRWVENA